jgi:hypothetical protein
MGERTVRQEAVFIEMLGYEEGIEPHIPVFDKSERKDGTFSRADFAYARGPGCTSSSPWSRSNNVAAVGGGRRPADVDGDHYILAHVCCGLPESFKGLVLW